MKYTHGGDIYTTEYRLDFSANICPFGANEAVRQAARGKIAILAPRGTIPTGLYQNSLYTNVGHPFGPTDETDATFMSRN